MNQDTIQPLAEKLAAMEQCYPYPWPWELCWLYAHDPAMFWGMAAGAVVAIGMIVWAFIVAGRG